MSNAFAQDAGVPAPPAVSIPLEGEARILFDVGMDLVDNQDYANARDKFRRAHALVPDYQILWNIVVCEINLHRYARALDAIDEFLREGQGKLIREERERAVDARAKLSQLVTSVTVLVSEPGAVVTVDGERIGVSPLSAPVLVDPGKRMFHIEKPGFLPIDVSRTFEEPGKAVVTAKLAREWHRGTLVVEARAKDTITLDGKVVALGRYEGLVPSGGHSLRVSAPGMLAQQTDVVVKDGEPRRISVTLDAIPVAPDLSQWAWVGAGAAVFTGAVIIGAILFRPTVAPEARGTIGTFPVSSSWSRP